MASAPQPLAPHPGFRLSPAPPAALPTIPPVVVGWRDLKAQICGADI